MLKVCKRPRKISLIKPRTFSPKELLKCFLGCCQRPTLRQAQHPEEFRLWSDALLPEFTGLSDKEMKYVLHCVIYDPEKVLDGLEDLRDEHWTGRMNGI
jgi:hypothetical protein